MVRVQVCVHSIVGPQRNLFILLFGFFSFFLHVRRTKRLFFCLRTQLACSLVGSVQPPTNTLRHPPHNSSNSSYRTLLSQQRAIDEVSDVCTVGTHTVHCCTVDTALLPAKWATIGTKQSTADDYSYSSTRARIRIVFLCPLRTTYVYVRYLSSRSSTPNNTTPNTAPGQDFFLHQQRFLGCWRVATPHCSSGLSFATHTNIWTPFGRRYSSTHIATRCTRSLRIASPLAQRVHAMFSRGWLARSILVAVPSYNRHIVWQQQKKQQQKKLPPVKTRTAEEISSEKLHLARLLLHLSPHITLLVHLLTPSISSP